MSERVRRLVGIVAPLLVAGAYAGYARALGYVSDDGFIGLRYVKNLLAGDGLVYNAGERVEGYTNFLWLVVIAAGKRLTPGIDLPLLTQILGVFFGAGSILLVCRFSREVCGEKGAFGLLAACFLAAHASFAAWATSGLETTMFAAVLFGAAYSYVRYLRTGRGWIGAALLFAVLPLVRPDGLLFAGLTGLHLLIHEMHAHGCAGLRRALLWSLVFALVYGSYFLASFVYYGELLPNTFHAKVVGSHQYTLGLRYVSSYFATHGMWVFLPVVWLLLRRPREAWQDYFAVLLTAYLAYVVRVGGDGLAFFRFFAHVAPLLYLLVQASYAALARAVLMRAPRRWRPAAATAVILGVAISLAWPVRGTAGILLRPASHRWYEPQSELHFPGIGSDHDYRWFDNYFVDRQKVAAHWLAQNAPPGSLVASTPAGAIAYYMNHAVIDMLGLNDHHIARTAPGRIGFPRVGHMKGDGSYVLDRDPDFILLGNVAVMPWPLDEQRMGEKLVRKSEHEIWADPRLRRDYELVSVRVGEDGPFQFFSFYRRAAIPDVVQQR